MRLTFRILGLLNLANGLWMLLAPAGWYLHLPAAVPDTGPLNPHFVRDIGAAFTTIGVVLFLAAPSRGVLLAVTLFYVLHAVVHVADLSAGRTQGGGAGRLPVLNRHRLCRRQGERRDRGAAP